MGVVEKVEGWLFQVAARKVITAGVKALIAFIAAAKIQGTLTSMGVTYDPVTLEAGLTAMAYGALEAAHDWAKLKFPNVIKF